MGSLKAGVIPDPGLTLTLKYSASQVNDANGNYILGFTGTQEQGFRMMSDLRVYQARHLSLLTIADAKFG